MHNCWYSAKTYASLVTGLLDAAFTDFTALVNWQRAVKSGRELRFMCKAGRYVEKMQSWIFDKIETGMLKSSLVAEIYDAELRYDPSISTGGDYPAIKLFRSGSDAATTSASRRQAHARARGDIL